NSPNPRKNPLVPLPIPAQELLQNVEALLVTHTHSDHWDANAAKLLPKQLPLFGQPEDEQKFRAAGFAAVSSIQDSLVWNGIKITRTGGRHGKGEIGRKMAPVSGFILRDEGEPTLYIAGDSIWCSEVQNALRDHQPHVIVVNVGAAQFLEGNPITMTADDVIIVCQARPRRRWLPSTWTRLTIAFSPAPTSRSNSRLPGLVSRWRFLKMAIG